MSAAAAGQAAAVTASGSCQRTVQIGPKQYVIKQTWRVADTRGVLLVTVLVDERNPNRITNKLQTYVENDEAALSSKAMEMVDRILKTKRDRFFKSQQGGSSSSGGSSSGGSSSVQRTNADGGVSDPVLTALRGGVRTRSGRVTKRPAVQEVR